MTVEDTGDRDHQSSDAAANIAALEHEVQLLRGIRDGMASKPGSDVMVEAVTGLIEERQAELDRSREPLE